MTTNQNPPLPLGCFDPLDHLPVDGAIVWCVNDTYYYVEQRVHYKGNFGHNGHHPVAGGGDDHILSWSHDPNAAAQHAAWLRLTFRDYTIHPNHTDA